MNFPGEVISIGDDPGGNQICIGISGKYIRNIYFWDHETECTAMSDLVLLSDSFDKFFNNLY
jgi:hypothetical protein